MTLPTILRTALAVVLALLAPLARAGTYVVVLDPAATGEHVLHDADVAGSGAAITGRAYGLLYIDGSAGAASALAAHSGVKYVQPVGDAEPPSPRPQAEPAGGHRIVTNQAPPTWSSGEYQYDGAGNIYAIGDATLPGGDGTKIAYTYDTLSRLKTVGVSDAGHPSLRNESYAYDVYGNLTNYVTPSTVGGTGSIVTNSTNNQVTSLSYDKAGNVTSDGTSLLYVRDPLNMIIVNQRVGGTDVNLYTADDERLAEGSGGYWTWSFRGFDQKVLRQYRSPATNPFAPWLWVEDYVYAGGRLVAAERPAEEGRRRHLHLDHLGTPRLVTGDFGRLISQHDYTAYGIEYQPDSGTAANQETAAGFDREEPMRFTGHERGFTGGTGSDNATSLDYMHARFYVATMGRFLSVDPLRDSARSTEPQTWNRYAYVRNNPINRVDRNGLIDVRSDQDKQVTEAPATLVTSSQLIDSTSRGVEYGAILGANGKVSSGIFTSNDPGHVDPRLGVDLTGPSPRVRGTNELPTQSMHTHLAAGKYKVPGTNMTFEATNPGEPSSGDKQMAQATVPGFIVVPALQQVIKVEKDGTFKVVLSGKDYDAWAKRAAAAVADNEKEKK